MRDKRVKVAKSSLKKCFEKSGIKNYNYTEDFYYVKDGTKIQKKDGSLIAVWNPLLGGFYDDCIYDINIAKDFSKAPAGRYRDYGEFSAERFREEFLVPAFKNIMFTKINIILDGLDGIGASFWDEAFGGLIIKEGISLEEINKKLILVCNDDIVLIPLIKRLLKDSNEKKYK